MCIHPRLFTYLVRRTSKRIFDLTSNALHLSTVFWGTEGKVEVRTWHKLSGAIGDPKTRSTAALQSTISVLSLKHQRFFLGNARCLQCCVRFSSSSMCWNTISFSSRSLSCKSPTLRRASLALGTETRCEIHALNNEYALITLAAARECPNVVIHISSNLCQIMQAMSCCYHMRRADPCSGSLNTDFCPAFV